MIDNVKIYGFSDSVKASKYPMSTDVDNCFDMANWIYWKQYGNFLGDFYKYQKDFGREKTKDNRVCCFCGSDANVESYKDSGKKYCSKHRHQLERYGKCFETTPKYELCDDYVLMTVYGDRKNEQQTKISYESLPFVFYWGCTANGDSYVKTDNGEPLHRRLMQKELTAEKNVVDHINRDIFDNRKTNLRVCTARENTLNGKVPKNNTSGVIGVSFSKSKNKWKAFINKDYKQLFLGYYETMTDAVRARLIAERIMYGEFAPQGDLSEEFGVKVEEKECPTECTHNLQQILKEMHRAVTLGTSKAGCGEDNYLNGIIVQFDLTFSIKAWVEAERYHFLDFVSSQSTMHRIAKMDIASQCNEYVTDEVIQCVNRLRDVYNTDPTAENYLKLLYNVPVGFRLTARMTTNYRQLKTIYHQRKNHRLPEWRDFCGWIETLPHSELIIGGD